ncbi:Hypothetical predicted protein [Mytilus galloprovincialis]|uniref:Reverse transcriptase RNase H-like domain-containing protein n=1 Tax=Mytilus galloprovincialis TaxID=29158 RepID=A0A8B6C421_MYTGA|nr:Hypothetical predicted protein [Mytilus galloprovincialis]
MLKDDIIEESNSEWQSPVVMCKKKSGEMRFCVDYRLEDVFDALGKAQASIFSTLDLLSGYWQCGLDPKTAHKAAFVTPSGWRVTNGNVYHLQILEEHLNHLQLVFDKLISAGLTLKPGKCLFARKEVIYLGHTISKEGVKVDTSKVDAVSSFPVPKNQKQIRSFLGLTNYYRKFIEGYSHITTSLNHLLRNDIPFEWSEKCQKAFDQLKKALCSAPILVYPNMSKPFILTTDASGTAIGYILGQLDSKGQEKVIAYGGRSLTQGERAWGVSELECLAVLEGIKSYHVYLANSHFKVYTDHQALKWLTNIKQSTGRLARWSVLLQGYSYDICFCPGKKNGNADCLSRREYSDFQSSSEPEDVIPSVNLISISSQESSEPLQVNFFYTPTNSSIPSVLAVDAENTDDSVIETDPEQTQIQETHTEVMPENIGPLQKECFDFKHIYAYLENGTLPDETKLAPRKFV